MANVRRPILGTDFLSAFNLVINVRQKRLIDHNTSLSVYASVTHISTDFAISSLKSPTAHEVLKDFPELLRLPSAATASTATHGVTHAIITRGRFRAA